MITKIYLRIVNGLERQKSKKGQTLVEYGLILALTSVLVIAVLNLMGNQLKGIFGRVTSTLTQVAGS